MQNCPACSEGVTDGSRTCPSCGEPLEELSTTVTKAQTPHSAPRKPEGARFNPGDVLAGRYRIALLVGEGGMGEIYRANDLELGQAVALKFLPTDIQDDETKLARFRREVRIARQVAHPNVCRVYDIGQVNGQHFLSMEYIDGEDLGSLLRRIGRLPGGKAIEIARELCAGLAATHEKGVLHRDLKPGNVMIDGRGKVRLTDFGIAGMIERIDPSEVRIGTPAFMAPEQWTGGEVSIKTDLYSLGLVLYELFTGKRAFAADTAQEMSRLQRDTTPRNPSSLVGDLDPAVERVILRCLEKNPDQRPLSARAVAAALPGGDPLAAALAAGETPSPELVAEAGDVGALKPAVAWACLATVVVQVSLLGWMASGSQLSGLTSLPKSPVLLVDRARQVIRDSGYVAPPRDSSYGFSLQEDYIEFVMANDPSPQRWNRVARGERSLIRFWYRQSPHYLIPQRLTSFFATANDPPPLLTDMVKIELDPKGRLRAFDAVAPEFDDTPIPTVVEEPDWSRFFAEAGLDLNDFAPAATKWNPASYATRLAAWEGVYPDSPATLIRVEAASYRGRPVAFRIIEPWTLPSRMNLRVVDDPGRPTGKVFSPLASVMHIAANVLALLGGALLARRNLRLGRGDRRGAFRLALYMFSLVMLHWIFGAHHVAGSSEVDLLFGALYRAFFTFALAWLFYVALEPYVRRVWPEMMISWLRLLDGRFRDPLVGRHVLMGCIAGAMLELVQRAYQFIPTALGYFAPRPDRFGNPSAELVSLRGVRYFISEVFLIHSNTLITALYFIVALFLLRFLLRKTPLAVAVWLALASVVYYINAGQPHFDWMVMAAWASIWLFSLFRFGWVTVVVALFVMDVLSTPLSFDPSVWYSSTSILTVAMVFGLAVYGFKVSLGEQPAFRDVVGETDL